MLCAFKVLVCASILLGSVRAFFFVAERATGETFHDAQLGQVTVDKELRDAFPALMAAAFTQRVRMRWHWRWFSSLFTALARLAIKLARGIIFTR